jgi:hypothetical protein
MPAFRDTSVQSFIYFSDVPKTKLGHDIPGVVEDVA